LTMMQISDDMRELAKPSLQSAQLYGLPADALPYQASLSARHTDHQDWDFVPWFYEKIGNVKTGTKYAIDWWESSPDDVTNDEIEDKAGFLREELLSSLGMARTYAKVIFDQLCNFKLELEAGG